MTKKKETENKVEEMVQAEEKELQENQEQEVVEGVHEEPEVLFYVSIKEKKVILRSTPEFKIDASNMVGTIEDQELRKVVEIQNGYGRLYPEDAWIDLVVCNKI